MKSIQDIYTNEEIENAIGLLSDLEIETGVSYKDVMVQLQSKLI